MEIKSRKPTGKIWPKFSEILQILVYVLEFAYRSLISRLTVASPSLKSCYIDTVLHLSFIEISSYVDTIITLSLLIALLSTYVVLCALGFSRLFFTSVMVAYRWDGILSLLLLFSLRTPFTLIPSSHFLALLH